MNDRPSTTKHPTAADPYSPADLARGDAARSVEASAEEVSLAGPPVGSTDRVNRVRDFRLSLAVVFLVIVIFVTLEVDAAVTLPVVAVAVFAVYRYLLTRETERAGWASRHTEGVTQLLRKQHSRNEQLNSAARQNASVLFQMRDGIVVLAPGNEILLVNPSARRLLAIRARDEIVGRQFTDVIRIPQVNSALKSVQKHRTAQEVDVEIVDDSLVRPVRIRVDQIEMGNQSNVLLAIRDETETKRVEQIRREFTANVSHELKTPLAAIKGYAETVGMAIDDDPDAAKHFMSQIGMQCVRLEELIADMMELARAQSGSDQLNLERLPLADLLTESIETNQPIAAARGVELRCRRVLIADVDTQSVDSPRNAIVFADREATLTVANNLLGNAIRYTPAGGQVEVSIVRDGEFWLMRVEDDGVGIDPAEHDRIFERFYRVEKTREANRGGTGLGLSIVKHLSIAQGGDVQMRSKPGDGATFEVRLPAASTGEIEHPLVGDSGPDAALGKGA